MKQLVAILFVCCILASCKKIDVFEKRVSIPHHKWERGFVPTFDFQISKNDDKYMVYAIVRHHNNYPYQNIWLKVNMKAKDTTYSFPINVKLTANNKNTEWVNSGMGDVYEVIQKIDAVQQPIGNYTFSIENIMSDDPLNGVLNIGLRIERLK